MFFKPINLLVLFISLWSITYVTGQTEQPNVILIITDDQSSIPLRSIDDQNQSRPFGFNGDNKVHTPIIDNLAANGMVFSNAFVSSSICSPSRYSFLTGRYAGRSEGTKFLNNFPLGSLSRISNNIELEETRTNLPKQLQDLGYKTAFIGKSHVIDHNFLETYTQGVNGFMSYTKTDDPYDSAISDAISFNHDKWANRMKEFGFDYVDAFYAANLRELKNDILNVHNVEYKNKSVVDFIDSSGAEPFFICYNETIPHGPAPYWFNNGSYYAGLDADVNITSKGVLTQDYSYLPSRSEIKNEISAMSDKDLRHAWLRWFDYAVGAVINKLEEKGKLDNTLIIITSDHGDFNHGKATNYEGGIKVPMLMYWKNGITAGTTYQELVQNIDLAPTILDLAGANLSNSDMDGQSLKNVIVNNSTVPIHDYLFFELGFSRAIRTKDWKYITVRYDDATNTKISNGQTFNGPNGTQVSLPYYVPNVSLGSIAENEYSLYHVQDQLFDINNDPYETQNVFDSNPEKATELRNILRTKLLSFPNRPYQEFTDVDYDLTINNNSSNSIVGKVIAGYQGWFNTPTDGSDLNWKHYQTSVNGVKKFEPGEVTIDLWPDMSEADVDEKYDTQFTHKDGSVATVFSSANSKTVNRHFKWMNDYGIDGAFIQRFALNLKSNAPKLKANNNVVLNNAISGAIEHNRLIGVMYDLSGANVTGTMVNDIKLDWQELVTQHELNNSSKAHLLTYNQKPIVAIWGVGFNRTDNYTLDDVQELVNFFKNDPNYGGCTVLLGVPRSWRTLNNDSTTNSQLHDVILSADIVHPWTPGRYSDINGIDSHKNIIAADKAWCDANNLLYMPVVFPGFSWQNLKKSQGTNSDLNATSRLKGDFLWRQFYNALDENVETIYVAMFDEMDEGTCIFKVDQNPPSSGQSQFTNYDGLPSDYYLWLTGQAGQALRNEITLTIDKPVYPNLPQVTAYYVDEFGDDSNTGTSQGTAFASVHNAYNASNSDNTINISGSVIQNSKVNVKKSIDFVGTNNATLFPNQNKVGTDRLFHISMAGLDVSFSDITFKGNKESSINGGAINMNADSNLTFTNCVFDDNSTGGVDKAGGGLFFSEGNVTIANSIFKNNLSRGNGGAISGSGVGTAIITESLFINNTAANVNKDGVGDRANGGAINIFGDGRKVIMSHNTFYNNTATFKGGGLYFGGLNNESVVENITVYANHVSMTSTENAAGGGIKIEGNRNFEIKNSLIYDNQLGDLYNGVSDVDINSVVSLNYVNSISGVSVGLGSDDLYATSIIDADLSSSNLRYDETLGKVIYDQPISGTDSPIDFGDDGNDAGAWDSMQVLSIEDDEHDNKAFSLSFNRSDKSLNVFSFRNSDMLISIYNINGAKVLSKMEIKRAGFIPLQGLRAGIYIISVLIDDVTYSKKFILY